MQVIALRASAAVLGACLLAPAGRPATQNRPYLEAALDAARWVRAAGVRTDAGLTWPADPKDPKSATKDPRISPMRGQAPTS